MSGVVWVTGATGFTGRHLCSYLKETQSVEVIGVDLRESEHVDCDRFHALDLLRLDDVRELIDETRPDSILHLAGLVGSANPADLWSANVGTLATMLAGILHTKRTSTRILSIGSAAEYAPSDQAIAETHPLQPPSAYGVSKWGQSQLAIAAAAQHDLSVVVVKPFNIVGPGQAPNLLVGNICDQIRRGRRQLELGNLTSIRDYVDVRDVVRGYWAALSNGVPGEGYNLCSGAGVSGEQILQMCSDIVGEELTTTVNAQALRSADLSRVVGDNRKANQQLQWSPEISLENSLQDMLAEG